MVPPNLPQHLEDLHGEFTSRREDEGAEPVVFGPSGPVELFEDGYEEGEGLAAAGLGGSEDVEALEGEGDGAGLDLGEGLEVGGIEAGGGGFGKR